MESACGGTRGVRSDADSISLEVEEVSLLGMGQHPLTHQLHPKAFAAYMAQAPMHSDVIVC